MGTSQTYRAEAKDESNAMSEIACLAVILCGSGGLIAQNGQRLVGNGKFSAAYIAHDYYSGQVGAPASLLYI